MTLEEAKEIVKEHCMYESPVEDVEEAIDTVLKALEDSIPKEKVREKIKELGKDIPMMTPRYFEWDSSEVIKLLEELLGEE